MAVRPPLDLVATWPVDHAAVGVVRPDGSVAAAVGDPEQPFRLASVTKLISTTAVLVALEEETVSLDDPVGPEGSTFRHLLAHASGLGPDGERLAAVGRRRIYSNGGFDLLGEHVAARSGMSFAAYAAAAVLEPLGLAGTRMGDHAAHGATGSLDDMLRLAGEYLSPTLIAPSTMAEATTVAFPGLSGVLPGFGRFDPNDWGLGFEIRGSKSPHWTGTRNSPRTFGHFGASGTFLWVDPEASLACVALTDREFGPWAIEAWPRLSDAVVAAYGPAPI